MGIVDQSWKAIPAWAGGVDQCGLAAYAELAMARAPLGRVARPDRPAGAGGRDTSVQLRRQPTTVRGRPGKRW